MFVYVPHDYMVSMEAKRGHWIPWNWKFQIVCEPLCRRWEPIPGCLLNQWMLLTTEQTPQKASCLNNIQVYVSNLSWRSSGTLTYNLGGSYSSFDFSFLWEKEKSRQEHSWNWKLIIFLKNLDPSESNANDSCEFIAPCEQQARLLLRICFCFPVLQGSLDSWPFSKASSQAYFLFHLAHRLPIYSPLYLG